MADLLVLKPGMEVALDTQQLTGKAEEIEKISGSFTTATEIPYKGAEDLIVAETPPDRQWEFLQLIRTEDTSGSFGIPGKRPESEALKALTVATLKGLKGRRGCGAAT